MSQPDFSAMSPAQRELWRRELRTAMTPRPNPGIELAKRHGLIERVPGWGNTYPSIAEQVGMQRPSPGDYLRQLGPKIIDEQVAGYDRSTPRQGVEL